jgi:hypothetical protein
MPMRPCLACGTPTAGSRCDDCQRQALRQRETNRPTRQARGYGTHYEHRRARLRATARAQRLPCALCDQAIRWDEAPPHPESFSAHHTTRDKRGPLVQTHLVCNIRAGQPAE